MAKKFNEIADKLEEDGVPWKESKDETEAKVAKAAVMGEQQLQDKVTELEAENKRLQGKLRLAQANEKSLLGIG